MTRTILQSVTRCSNTDTRSVCRTSGFVLEWFAENYAELKSALADISPVRNRVSYPVAFDQIWHYIFGIANQKLVEAGLFADPYAPGTAFQGYVPAVYVQGMGWLREGL